MAAQSTPARAPQRRRRSRIEEGGLDVRRQQILDAAKKCFSKLGLRQTTIRNIAEEAGMSVGHIYNSFGSKEEIVEAMAREQAKTFSQLLIDETRANEAGERGSPERYFSRMLDLMLDSESASLVVSFMHEALTNPKIHALMADLLKGFRDEILEVCEREFPVDRDLLRARIMFMISVFQGLRFTMLFYPQYNRALLKQVALERLMQWVAADAAETEKMVCEARALSQEKSSEEGSN